MATDAQLQILHQDKRWYLYATFHIVRKPFHQIFSIHTFIGRGDVVKQVQLAFVLMSSRRKRYYKYVMKSLLDQLSESPRVTEIIIDFERAMCNGVSATLQDVKILGCLFHWTQAVWQETQELGLKPTYLNEEGVHLYIRKLLSLPFLPADQNQPLFDNMTKDASGE